MPSATQRARQLLHAIGAWSSVYMHARAHSARAPFVQAMHVQQFSAHGAGRSNRTLHHSLPAGTAGRGGVLPNLLF
eukprot:6706745-Alexandrium_andersonii.AAC.1